MTLGLLRYSADQSFNNRLRNFYIYVSKPFLHAGFYAGVEAVRKFWQLLCASIFHVGYPIELKKRSNVIDIINKEK